MMRWETKHVQVPSLYGARRPYRCKGNATGVAHVRSSAIAAAYPDARSLVKQPCSGQTLHTRNDHALIQRRTVTFGSARVTLSVLSILARF
jgi:hypothetical protein